MDRLDIEIYDTTLRDGTQRSDISLSLEDKLRIARRLDDLGVAYIEGGWPGSNPKDVEFFQRAAQMDWKNARIASFGATRKAGSQPEHDANIQALVEANTPVCTVFGKTWTLHVTEVLRTTLEENLRMIEDSLAYLIAQGKEVIYDAEHYFDGYKANPEYALETLRAAERGGVKMIVLCDTNGGTMPWEISEWTRAAMNTVSTKIGIHTHNDSDCAVANTLAAVREGATHVQGTINGIGERCGNVNLCAAIPNLELKLNLRCLPAGKVANLYELSHFVSEVANLTPNEHMAYVGRSAFAHKGGVHVHAIRRVEHSYQHIDPVLVGNEMRVVVSELSGRANLLSKAEEYGVEIGDGETVPQVLREVKEMESRGFSFEAAEASVIMMLKRQQAGYQAPFELIDFSVMVEHRQGRGIFAEATVKVKVGGKVYHTAAEGNGPVAALDEALRKALVNYYPVIDQIQLADYKVRILDSESGSAATTRVLIDTRYDSSGHDPVRWSTVGASGNIIEASWLALKDAYDYGLAVGVVNGKTKEAEELAQA
ncbi:MAG: citramalate synthase [Anaerolineaceae bacterium]|nr:citramalate synthase [Anaerolineaceae bacterium]